MIMMDFALKSKEFNKVLKNGMLIGSRCKACGSLALPQRCICPECHSENCEIIPYSGKGVLVAYTVIFVPPIMMADAGYGDNN